MPRAAVDDNNRVALRVRAADKAVISAPSPSSKLI